MTAESILAAMTARAEAAWREQRWPPPQGPTHLGPLMAEHIAAARTDVPRLVSALRAVLALHSPRSLRPYEYLPFGHRGREASVCSECASWESEFGEVQMPYPCPTVRAITATLEES